MSEPILDLTIYGNPEPAGSKQAQVVYRKSPTGPIPVVKNGRVVVTVRDANDKSKGWQAQVAQAVGEAWEGRPLVEGALRVVFTFYRTRNTGDYGTGRNAHLVKDSAPAYPITRPDVLKLARGVEDALTDVLWRDDSQITDERLLKRFGPQACVKVEVFLEAEQKACDLPLSERVRPGAPVPDPDAEPAQGSLLVAA